jgi:rhodanese-related sulfurtransferase
MKTTLKEIIFIIVISVALALLYNFSKPKPLPLIWEPKQLEQLSDDILFGSPDNYDGGTYNHHSEEVQEIAKTDIKSDKDDLSNENMIITPPKEEAIKEKDNIFANLEEKEKTDKPKEYTVTYQQMKRIIENPDFVIIDARSPNLYALNRIGNAINIFPYADETEYIPKILEIPPGKRIVVYCDGGNCDASHKLAETIKTFGYDNVFIYTGGWDDWTKHQGKK